jgi:hypothetical protein
MMIKILANHGPAIVERLQQMMFPNLDNNFMLDSIIDDCWHSRFPSIAALSESISQQWCFLKSALIAAGRKLGTPRS